MKQEKSRGCPKCGCEYRKDFAQCVDCGCNLVDINPKTESSSPYDEEWVVLVKDIGDMEADQIISLLSFYDIAAKKFYKGASQYVTIFTGSTSIGVYLIVKASQYRDAMDVLNADIEDDFMYEDES